MNQQALPSNTDLHNSLRLEIYLSGNTFDGFLNFGAIEITGNDGSKYLLDSLDTIGNPVESDKGEQYLLVTTFDTYKNTVETFKEDEEFDFSQSLIELLQTYSIARTNLIADSLMDENGEADINLSRLISMTLIDETNRISIPVENDPDY